MAGPPLYGFAYTARALARLRTFPKKHRQQIAAKVQALAADPRPPTCKTIKGMKAGEETVYRARSGLYRILYVIRATAIVVLDIDHRKDVYR